MLYVGVKKSDYFAGFAHVMRVVCGIAMALLVISGMMVLFFVRKMLNPINQALHVANTVAAGDLNVQIEVHHTDETGRLLLAMKNMIEKFREVVADVKNAADSVATGSSAISMSVSDMYQGATEQAASVEEVSSSMEEMSSNIRHNADNALNTEKIAMKSAEEARGGGWRLPRPYAR